MNTKNQKVVLEQKIIVSENYRSNSTHMDDKRFIFFFNLSAFFFFFAGSKTVMRNLSIQLLYHRTPLPITPYLLEPESQQYYYGKWIRTHSQEEICRRTQERTGSF